MYDFLTSNGVERVDMCKQIGPIWVDAMFTDLKGVKSAIILMGDGDVCKLNRTDLLGPISWRKRYLERAGIVVIPVHRRVTDSLVKLWSEPRLAHLVTTSTPDALIKRKISPIRIDHQLGKISFR